LAYGQTNPEQPSGKGILLWWGYTSGPTRRLLRVDPKLSSDPTHWGQSDENAKSLWFLKAAGQLAAQPIRFMCRATVERETGVPAT